LTRNEKPIVLLERNCHVTEKSEAIACARRYQDKVVDPKRIMRKNGGQRRRRSTRGHCPQKTYYAM
jgi:hypothetical protein